MLCGKFTVVHTILKGFVALSLILGICIGVSDCVRAQDMAHVVRLNRGGEKLVDEGHYRRARTTFSEMLRACGQSDCRAVALLNLGRVNILLGEYGEANDYLDQAERALRRLRDPDAPHWIGLVHSLRGRVYLARARFPSALDEFKKSERIFSRAMDRRKGPERARWQGELALVLGNVALCHIHLYQFDAARDYLKRAKKLAADSGSQRHVELDKFDAMISAQTQDFPSAEKSLKRLIEYFKSERKPKEQAFQLINLGQIDEQLSRYAQAQKRYDEALELARRVDNPPLQANVLDHIGTLQYRRGEYRQARKNHESALSIRRKLDQTQFLGLTLINLAHLDRAEGDYRSAMEGFRKALELGTRYKYRDVQAQALEGLGLVQKERGGFVEAKNFLQRALVLLRQISDLRVEAITLRRLAQLQEQYGRFDDALTTYREAIGIMQSIGDRLFLSETLADTASRYIRDGQFSVAERQLKHALSLKRQIGAPEGDVLCRTALFYVEKPRFGKPVDRAEDLKQSLHYLRRADEAVKSDEKPIVMLREYVYGKYFLEQEPIKSLPRFENLVSMAEESGNIRFAFLGQTGLGLAYEQLLDWDKAEAAYEKAVEIAEDIRNTLDEQSRVTFMHGEEILGVKHILPYEGLARVRMKRGDPTAALKAVELAKARAFRDTMERSIRHIFWKTGGALANQWQENLERTRSTTEQLRKLLNTGGSKSVLAVVQNTIRRLKQSSKQLGDKIRQRYPDYYGILFASSSSIDRSALRDDEWMLSYEVTDTATLIFLTRGKEIVETRCEPIDRAALDKLVETFTSPFASIRYVKDLKQFDTASLRAGKRLFDLLVAPFLEKIPDGVSLIVSPDDSLGVVPFEMLVMNDTGKTVTAGGTVRTEGVDFFMQRHPISYYHSVTALTYSRERAERKGTPAKKFLVIANPQLQCNESSRDHPSGEDRDGIGPEPGDVDERITETGESNRLRTLSPESCRFVVDALGELKTTGELVGYLQKTFPDATDAYTRKTATLGVFENKIAPRINGYGKVVFATHGILGGVLDEVQEPAVLLSMQSPNSNSWLKMSRVLDLDLNADLVYLLACQTGRGVQVAGEGSMSMGRAFLLAGARSVLMSLWTVDESASVALAEQFFSGLREGMSKEHALSRARKQLRSLRGGMYDHPFYWAAFILVGEGT